jgi:hypothetical protein
VLDLERAAQADDVSSGVAALDALPAGVRRFLAQSFSRVKEGGDGRSCCSYISDVYLSFYRRLVSLIESRDTVQTVKIAKFRGEE